MGNVRLYLKVYCFKFRLKTNMPFQSWSTESSHIAVETTSLFWNI